MNNEDMSDVMKNFSNLLDGKEVPDNLKKILNNLKISNQDDSNDSNTNNSSGNIDPNMVNNILNMFNSSNENSGTSNGSSSSGSSNIDIETILKMKTIIDKMNNTKNDPRANLLLSLKPYLKDSRKDKVEQYIKLLNMSKVIDVFNMNGGGKNK